MNKNEIEIVQNNLVHIRGVLHISQGRLAEMLGVKRQTIYNYETGRNKLPGPAYIAIKTIVENYRLIDESLSEENYLLAQKLLTTKVSKVNYIKSLEFEESN